MDKDIQTTSGIEMAGDNLGYFFADSVARRPDKIAVIDLVGPPRIRTYRALDERMNRVAVALQRLGLVPGDRAGLMLGNRVEYLETFFGAMRGGIVPVPVNPRLAAETQTFILRDAGCRGAIVDFATLPAAETTLAGLDLPVRVGLGPAPAGFHDYDSLLDGTGAAAPAVSVSADDPAFQPYTAGSTGRPKGVLLTHRGMLWGVRQNQRYWPAEPTERGLAAVPLVHKNAMRGIVKPMLHAGGSVVILPGFEPLAFLDALEIYRCTFASGVPAIFTMLLRHSDAIRSKDLSALRSFHIGSAVVPTALLDALEGAFPGVALKEAYGLTEGGGPLRAPIDGRPVPRGSCGVPAPETAVKLVDASGAPSPREGELWVRSPAVPLGYHNRPELTRERIVDGWLRTGDVFRVDEAGFFYFQGRIDDMFSCGGENIYPREVETMLLRHPAVADAAVVPLPHEVKGVVPAAAVVPRPSAAVTEEELRRHCLRHGPAYAHPRRILLVEALPLNSAGKPDRPRIRALFADAGAVLDP